MAIKVWRIALLGVGFLAMFAGSAADSAALDNTVLKRPTPVSASTPESASTPVIPSAVDPVFDDGFQLFSCAVSDNPQPNRGMSEEPGSGACPAGMVAVSTFCVDRYEAALIDTSVPASPQPWSPYRNPGNTPVRAVSARFAVPQGYISGTQAAAACAAAGKRLCTNTEWLRACRGPSSFTYPYGNTRIAGQCNDARSTHPAVEYFGTTDSWIYSELDHPCLNQLRNGLDRVGTNLGCQSVEGPYDMMGNLHEWTSDVNGTFRGGFYVDTVINGNGCLYATTAHTFGYWDYSTGFRCCADP